MSRARAEDSTREHLLVGRSGKILTGLEIVYRRKQLIVSCGSEDFW